MINWTKCSEQMPPDDDEYSIIRGFIGYPTTISTNAFIHAYAKKHITEEWATYTEEAWKEVNKS